MIHARGYHSRRLAGRWVVAVILLLLSWALRLCLLDDVPPGWRDDELINIYALAGEVLEGHYPLYFTGASGHEPLYHYLQAAIHAALGVNVLSGHLLSISLGTLSVALTFALARRLLGLAAAGIACLGLGTSFWSLMYSRFALRHISATVFSVLAFYLLWRLLDQPRRALRVYLPLGLALGVGLYTYFATRLVPVVLGVFMVYLSIFDRRTFGRHWRGLALALVVAVLLFAPLGLSIGGADARVAELAVPLRELREGNLRPIVAGIAGTLGMFHRTGDPEWLYNLPGRPVFNALGALALWAGALLCVSRWRQPRYSFLLLWFLVGLSPAFVSTPPASLSHTIIAQPVVYILVGLAITRAAVALIGLATRMSGSGHRTAGAFSFMAWLLCASVVVTNVVRDQRDYFIIWPRQEMVGFLYRKDYRAVARYVDIRPELTDFGIAGTLLGPWDRLALDADTRRADVGARFFNPERALVLVSADGSGLIFSTMFPTSVPPLNTFYSSGEHEVAQVTDHAALHHIPPLGRLLPAAGTSVTPIARFANGLELTRAEWVDETAVNTGGQICLLTTWRVAGPLDLPHMPIVANPPPPGVYTGPRLAVFVHLLDPDGGLLDSDDGMWVDPVTFEMGDQFIQVHHLVFPAGADRAENTLILGLYDPMTGERWAILDPGGDILGDSVPIPIKEGGMNS